MTNKFRVLINELNQRTKSDNSLWEKTIGENCIETFFSTYGLRICKYSESGKTMIYLSVLDLNGSSIEDISVSELKDKIEFRSLLETFEIAKEKLLSELDNVLDAIINEIRQ